VGPVSGTLQSLFDAVSRLDKLSSRVNGYVTGASVAYLRGMTGGVVDRALNLRPGTVDDFVKTVSNIPNIVAGVRNIVHQATRRLPNDLLRDLKLLEEGVDGIGKETTRLFDQGETPVATIFASSFPTADGGKTDIPMPAAVEMVMMVELARDTLDEIRVMMELYGYMGEGTAISTALSSMPDEGFMGNARAYIIRQGDTLALLARAFYDNENQWPMLISANRNLFGIAASRLRGAGEISATDSLDRYIGEQLVIPAPINAASQHVPDVWDQPIGVRTFGTDLPDFLQVQNRPDGDKELLVLGPEETLLQGVRHRVETLRGTIPDRAEYGSRIPSMIGQNFGDLDDAMNSAKLDEALRGEPRLVDILNARATQTQDSLRIDFEAVARNAGLLGPINITVSRQHP
jgi:phage baseplate assembly protein W